MNGRIVLLSLFCSIICTNTPEAFLKEILPIQNVWSIYISQDGKKAAIRFKGQEDLSQIVQFQNVGVAQIRDSETWQIIKEFNNARFVTLSADSTLAGIVFGDSTAHIIELEKDTVVKKFQNVWNIVFSPDGKCAKVVFNDNTQLFETESWHLLKEFQNTEPLWLEFSPDSKNVGIAYTNGIAHLIRLSDWHIVQEFNNITNFGLAFSPDNNYLVVSHKDNTAQVITTDNWCVIKEFTDLKWLFFPRFSRDSKHLSKKSTNDTLQIIALDNWHTKLEKPNVIFSQLSRDSKYLWIIFADMSVQVIDVENGDVIIQDLDHGEECSFYPEQKIVIALSHEVRVYEI